MEKNEIDNYEEGLFEFSDNYCGDYLSDRIPETVKKTVGKIPFKRIRCSQAFPRSMGKTRMLFQYSEEKSFNGI